MLELTEMKKKEINKIKEEMFKRLSNYKESNNRQTLDAGHGNPIISKYKKEIKKVIENMDNNKRTF